MSGGTWRLLELENGTPDWNMAVDRAIQESRADDECAPTLRLYRFDPPSVTIGRFQDVADVDMGVLKHEGLGIARRPTGGRGVLHSDEVTYSIVAGVADGVPRGVAESYAYLSRFLVETYRLLGISAALTGKDRPSSQSGACYLQRTRADLMVDGRKLSGSAQVWSGDVCLQHGSIVSSRDPALEASLFRLDGSGLQALQEGTAAFGDVGIEIPTPDRIAEAAAEGLRTALGVELSASSLTPEEVDRATMLTEQFSIPAD